MIMADLIIIKIQGKEGVPDSSRPYEMAKMKKRMKMTCNRSGTVVKCRDWEGPID